MLNAEIGLGIEKADLILDVFSDQRHNGEEERAFRPELQRGRDVAGQAEQPRDARPLLSQLGLGLSFRHR